MKRRDIITRVAAGSVVGLGVSAGSGTVSATHVPTEELDVLYVKRDDEIVATIDDPTDAVVREVSASLDDDEQLVTESGTCYEYCCGECPPACGTCGCACWCPC